jgi:hypothetical protein
LVACPSPPEMAPGCLPYSSLVRILSFILHSPWLARWGICAMVWRIVVCVEKLVCWVVWAVRLCPPLLWLCCWMLACVDSTEVHAVTELLTCALVEKRMLVAHQFELCVAHMVCATIATPLVQIYPWCISICATHSLPF